MRLTSSSGWAWVGPQYVAALLGALVAHDAAHEAFKEALRSRSRAAPIRHLALVQRAQNYLARGKKSQARKDLERVLAEDSSYEGVREQLAELAS